MKPSLKHETLKWTALLSWQVSLITSPLCRKYKFKSAVWTHHFWLKILETSTKSPIFTPGTSHGCSPTSSEFLVISLLLWSNNIPSPRINSWKVNLPFGMAYFQMRTVRFRENVSNQTLLWIHRSFQVTPIIFHTFSLEETFPYHPCMLYLPTFCLLFNGKHMVNVRTYTQSHGSLMGFMNRHPHIEHRPECPGSSRKLKQWCHSPNKLPDQSSKPTDAVWL